MDKTNQPEDGFDEESEIPSVGKRESEEERPFWPYLFSFILVGAVIVWIYASLSSDDDVKLTDNQGEVFDRERVTTFDIPKRLPRQEAPAAITRTVQTIPIQPQLSAEELRRLKAERDLKERRKRSPIVIFDQINTRGANPSATASRTSFRQDDILSNLTKQLTDAKNGSGGLLGENNDEGVSGNNSLDSQLTLSKADTVQASLIDTKLQPYVITQGKIIGAVLETAIQSDLPGLVRAVLTENIYSFDGRLILLEKGSRAIGQYQSGIQRGQSRVFITWNRIITPNGIDITLNSPGTDTLGRSGSAGFVDSHFFERFGSSILLSVVGALTAREASSGATQSNRIQTDVSDSVNRTSEIALRNSINIPPTVNINQGTEIKIFVARDLNFKSAYQLNRRQTQKRRNNAISQR